MNERRRTGGLAQLGAAPRTTTTGYPWTDGDILYAADLNAAIASVSAGGPFLPLTGGIVSGDVAATTMLVTDHFRFAGTYSDGGGGYPAQPVYPLRMSGMAFIGSGWDSTYTIYGVPPAGTGSWIMQTWPGMRYVEKGVQLRVGSMVGGPAALHFTRASDNQQLATDPAVIATLSFSYNDAVGTRGSWAHYLEAHRIAGAGPAIGIEIETVSHGDDVIPHNPYGFPGGASPRTLAYGIGISAGGESQDVGTGPTYNCGNAISIGANPNRWKAGITFWYNALQRDTLGDETTPAHAILLGTGHQIEWHNGTTGVPKAYIRSDNAGGASTALVFGGDAFYVVGVANEERVAGFVPTAGAVNYLRILNNTTGGNPQIVAAGTDSNISVTMVGKGVGGVRLRDGASVDQVVVSTAGTTMPSAIFSGDAAVQAAARIVFSGSSTALSATPASGSDGLYVVASGAGEKIAGFFPVVGATNYVRITSTITAGTPTIISGGTDTNISLTLGGKGTGGVRLVDGASGPKVVINTTGIGFNASAPVAKPTGWGTSTGGARAAITAGSTLPQVAAGLAQLLNDLTAYGLIGV